MQIFANHLRAWCLFTLFGSMLLLFAGLGKDAVAATSPTIEKMEIAELNQIINNRQGNYLLFFTAAWCGHCKEMLLPLNRLFHRYRDKGLQFIGISVDAGGSAAMQQVLEKKQVDFSVFWVGESVIDELRLVGIPMIFLIKNGNLVEKIPGKCSYAVLEEKILEFMQ